MTMTMLDTTATEADTMRGMQGRTKGDTEAETSTEEAEATTDSNPLQTAIPNTTKTDILDPKDSKTNSTNRKDIRTTNEIVDTE